MPTIMCTRNLWRAIGGHAELSARSPEPSSPAKLGTWCARELSTRAGWFVVALEETTYLTVLCPILPQPKFLLAFSASVGAGLEAVGISRRLATLETLALLERSRFAKNDNRSLLGSVNDVAFNASVAFEDLDRFDLAAVERIQADLNRMPHVHRKPAFPDQATRLLYRDVPSA